MSITFQPKNSKVRRRKHGFMSRMATAPGRRIISNRRKKGRHRLGCV